MIAEKKKKRKLQESSEGKV